MAVYSNCFIPVYSCLVFKRQQPAIVQKKAASIETGSFEEEQKDIFSIQFAEAIQDALKANNYRLAIRLQYLQLLKTLSEKGIIKYQPDKTNFDYLLQTRSTSHYQDFLSATRSYEYSWYGLFPIDEDHYRNIENSFSDLHKK
ncbi:DUF4129 domain-containing protein [Niabella ginsengisoli]|uniref:DUF4129 domain-containing protein n=1 Tax=Niabella ginsengisoli TaxID=522298 RepID=A0ABS9SMH0_9BACT|nr:DUF4129 domain-containing protein [Niabella ginsengisoli]MCH5599572.1 DUF4129 domain-containing protein [Niabella ginsengisoli]